MILTAGFDKAPHVLALAELLRRDGITIAGVLVVSPYSWSRVRNTIRSRGGQFIWKSIPRLLGKPSASSSARPDDALTALMRENDIRPGSLRAWARNHAVPYRSVTSLNDESAASFVADRAPQWVLYGGGGILHDRFIGAAGGRVLNAHSGPLPHIRGMNACEWSLLLGFRPAVTIHFIDRGIDTGGTVSEHEVPVEPGDDIASLRAKCAAIGVQAMRQVVLDPPQQPLRRENGGALSRQCFILAPALQELLEKRLSSGALAHGPG